MKKSIIWIFLIAIFLTLITGCEMLERQSSISLNHYRIGEYSEKSGHPVLIFMENEESDKRVSLNMDGQKKLAKALYRYSGMIAVNATCSPEGRLLDYTVQDLFTGENYGKLDISGLFNTFDPGRFETVKMDDTEEIRLSELNPDVSYEYNNVNESHIKIVNDSGENVLVYYDDLADHQSGRYRLFGTCISGADDSLVRTSARKNCVIRFYPAEIDDMVRLFNGEEDSIIRLSNYHSGESFFVRFQTALYNNTGHDVVLTRSNGTEVNIPADELIRLDWNVEDWRTWESDFVLK